MGIIQTLSDVIRETADRFVSDVADSFRASIRPVYRVNRRRNIPEHVGTCTLLEYGAERILVTAAHVADHNTETSLYVGGTKDLVEVKDQFFATKAPAQNRDNDFLDFAASKLSPATLQAMGDVAFIPAAVIADHVYPPGANRLYACLGFPNSKNKEVHVGNRSVKTVLWKYSSYAVAAPALPGYPTTDQRHLFIDFDKKHTRDASGQVVNTIWPQGASGGPVFDIGDFADKSIVFPDCVCHPRLAAIILRKPRSASVLMSVRIQTVLAALAVHATK